MQLLFAFYEQIFGLRQVFKIQKKVCFKNRRKIVAAINVNHFFTIIKCINVAVLIYIYILSYKS